MRPRFGPFRLGLIGAALVLGCLGWFYVWSSVNQPSPAISDGPTIPTSIRLACLTGAILLLYASGWALAHWLRNRVFGKDNE